MFLFYEEEKDAVTRQENLPIHMERALQFENTLGPRETCRN